MELIEVAIKILCSKGMLPSEYLPHPLHGKYQGDWEAHLEADWLIVWSKDDINKIIHFVRTGTHSDLFKN